MANRHFRNEVRSLEPGLVELFAQVAIGASGAPTLSTANSKGIKSIVRNGAGDYTVTFGVPSGDTDTYNRVVDFDCTFIQLGATTLPAAPFVSIASRSTSTVRFLCADGDTPAATDPADGETMLLRFVLSNSGAV